VPGDLETAEVALTMRIGISLEALVAQLGRSVHPGKEAGDFRVGVRQRFQAIARDHNTCRSELAEPAQIIEPGAFSGVIARERCCWYRRPLVSLLNQRTQVHHGIGHRVSFQRRERRNQTLAENPMTVSYTTPRDTISLTDDEIGLLVEMIVQICVDGGEFL
jgi:hypothetical protein